MMHMTRRDRLQEGAGQLRDALRTARKGAEKADRTARELSQSEVRKKATHQHTTCTLLRYMFMPLPTLKCYTRYL